MVRKMEGLSAGGLIPICVQEWNGLILSIGETSFWARLIDLTCPGPEDEEAEILLGKLPDAERALVQPGAVFTWRISNKGESEFSFSRECWEEADLLQNKQDSKVLRRVLFVKEFRVDTSTLPRWKPTVILQDRGLGD